MSTSNQIYIKDIINSFEHHEEMHKVLKFFPNFDGTSKVDAADHLTYVEDMSKLMAPDHAEEVAVNAFMRSLKGEAYRWFQEELNHESTWEECKKIFLQVFSNEMSTPPPPQTSLYFMPPHQMIKKKEESQMNKLLASIEELEKEQAKFGQQMNNVEKEIHSMAPKVEFVFNRAIDADFEKAAQELEREEEEELEENSEEEEDNDSNFSHGSHGNSPRSYTSQGSPWEDEYLHAQGWDDNFDTKQAFADED